MALWATKKYENAIQAGIKIQNPKFQIPNSKQCLVFDAWDLEFKL